MEVSVKKPGSPSELVEHAGVKGMQWGVRKAPSTTTRRDDRITRSKAFKSFSKASDANVQRHFARQSKRTERKKESARERSTNPNVVARKEFRTKFPTATSKANEIRRARIDIAKVKHKFETEKDPIKKQQLREVYMNHPDRATALRTTRGEKVVFGLLAGVFPSGPFGVGIGIGTGIVLSKRRSIERQQARG